MNQDRGQFVPVSDHPERGSSRPSTRPWPTIGVGERVQVKGIWFEVVRFKRYGDRLVLRMLRTDELTEEDRRQAHGNGDD